MNGPAAGMQATQIVDSAGEAVVETHATPVNWSLQLTGRPGGFSWEGTYDGHGVMIILTRFFFFLRSFHECRIAGSCGLHSGT